MITLYIQERCPFCVKVMKAVDALGLEEGTDYAVVDASQGTPGRAQVVEQGGKSMVPFLVDADLTMYESSDIITYMKNKFIA